MAQQFLLLNFLLSIISAVWYSYPSSLQSLLKTGKLLLWSNLYTSGGTLIELWKHCKNLKMQFRLLWRWIQIPRPFLILKIPQLGSLKESSIRQHGYFVCLEKQQDYISYFYLFPAHLFIHLSFQNSELVYCMSIVGLTKKYNTWTTLSRSLQTYSIMDSYMWFQTCLS